MTPGCINVSNIFPITNSANVGSIPSKEDIDNPKNIKMTIRKIACKPEISKIEVNIFITTGMGGV